MKYVTGIFAALLAVLLLFMYPLYEQARSQDKLANAVVQGAAVRFVDNVRTKGYITPRIYEEFNAQLAATGNQYDVELEHLHKRYSPDYSDPADPATFRGSFTTFYDGFYNEQILPVLFPDNGRSSDDPSRRYTMQVGDYIGIRLKNVNRTAAVQLWDFLMNDNTEENAAILMNYEGMVLNEDY
ncbi:hypothetical protein [Saccharibacillus alkalitolerans]|uniref:Uncharacterized protein n=1 Tax=Saccharibacillus alkalitolerans TaxID=2705290 RepID=A0ABX0F5P1_9BACL|nr:hypothetical protein [Saccharibacillus alkalitolerans]NGZ74501.1 hypothetical protein [Saccharibacillus alkalitolerans]